MINNNVGDVSKAFFLQFYSQVFQTGCLRNTEGSAGLEKGDHGDRAVGVQHRVLIPDAPGWRLLAEGALPLAPRSRPGQEAESQGKPQAAPHGWGCRRGGPFGPGGFFSLLSNWAPQRAARTSGIYSPVVYLPALLRGPESGASWAVTL